MKNKHNILIIIYNATLILSMLYLIAMSFLCYMLLKAIELGYYTESFIISLFFILINYGILSIAIDEYKSLTGKDNN